MARGILLAATVALAVAAVVALGVAAIGTEALEHALPPLAIDTEALRGAVVTVGVALGLLATAHGLVLVGLRGERRLAWTVGILLAALMTATCVALAAAALTSAIATPGSAPGLVATGAAASVAAAAYGVVTVSLVRERGPLSTR